SWIPWPLSMQYSKAAIAKGFLTQYFQNSRVDVTNRNLNSSATYAVWFYGNTSGNKANIIFLNIYGENILIAN
ncbi:MAG: hypothetical protein AB2653_08655, partial [Candidatus Thiodiazotropha endolucinida]